MAPLCYWLQHISKTVEREIANSAPHSLGRQGSLTRRAGQSAASDIASETASSAPVLLPASASSGFLGRKTSVRSKNSKVASTTSSGRGIASTDVRRPSIPQASSAPETTRLSPTAIATFHTPPSPRTLLVSSIPFRTSANTPPTMGSPPTTARSADDITGDAGASKAAPANVRARTRSQTASTADSASRLPAETLAYMEFGRRWSESQDEVSLPTALPRPRFSAATVSPLTLSRCHATPCSVASGLVDRVLVRVGLI